MGCVFLILKFLIGLGGRGWLSCFSATGYGSKNGLEGARTYRCRRPLASIVSGNPAGTNTGSGVKLTLRKHWLGLWLREHHFLGERSRKYTLNTFTWTWLKEARISEVSEAVDGAVVRTYSVICWEVPPRVRLAKWEWELLGWMNQKMDIMLPYWERMRPPP